MKKGNYGAHHSKDEAKNPWKRLLSPCCRGQAGDCAPARGARPRGV